MLSLTHSIHFFFLAMYHPGVYEYKILDFRRCRREGSSSCVVFHSGSLPLFGSSRWRFRKCFESYYCLHQWSMYECGDWNLLCLSRRQWCRGIDVTSSTRFDLAGCPIYFGKYLPSRREGSARYDRTTKCGGILAFPLVWLWHCPCGQGCRVGRILDLGGTRTNATRRNGSPPSPHCG